MDDGEAGMRRNIDPCDGNTLREVVFSAQSYSFYFFPREYLGAMDFLSK